MVKLTVALTIVTVCFALSAAAQPTTVVPPLAFPGPYPVACSNVDAGLHSPCPGRRRAGVLGRRPARRRLVALHHGPAGGCTGHADRHGAGSRGQRRLRLVRRAKRSLRHHRLLPDRGGQRAARLPAAEREDRCRTCSAGPKLPLFPDATTRFPVLLFSHGYLGSPTSNDYIDALALLASFGYVVAAPFHGDGRFGTLQLENLTDLPYLILHLRDFLAMQALRPLSLSATLDLLLAASAMARPPRSRGDRRASARVSAANRCC